MKIQSYNANNHLHFYVFENDTKIGWLIKHPYSCAGDLLILSPYQRKGIATKLVNLCIEEMRKLGLKKIQFSTSKSSHEAIAFYHANQFHVYDETETMIFFEKYF